MTAAAPAPRRLPLRFSLRVLLLAVTAFAVGFPIWYRWPYEEEQVSWAKDATGKDDHSRPPDARRVKTWQRQWGSGRLQHGEERYYIGGKLVELTSYATGKLHGPSRRYDFQHGYVAEQRFYDRGVRVGVWKNLDGTGRERSRTEYQAGRFVRAVSTDRDGTEHVIECREVEGKPRIVVGEMEIEDRLARLVDEGRIDETRIAEQLMQPTVIEFVETPLKDAADFLGTQHEIPIQLDLHQVDRDLLITGIWDGVPLSTGLTLLGMKHGFACDYRYGCVWITSPDAAKERHDPTGVADIVPPKDSQLARSWNEPVKIHASNLPLAVVLEGEAQRLAINLDTSRIAEGGGEALFPVTQHLSGVKFRHALGILLYQTRCRCKLEGETLVILPAEM